MLFLGTGSGPRNVVLVSDMCEHEETVWCDLVLQFFLRLWLTQGQLAEPEAPATSPAACPHTTPSTIRVERGEDIVRRGNVQGARQQSRDLLQQSPSARGHSSVAILR